MGQSHLKPGMSLQGCARQGACCALTLECQASEQNWPSTAGTPPRCRSKDACKHPPDGCRIFLGGGTLSPHPAHSASKPRRKCLTVVFSQGSFTSAWGPTRGPTLIGKGRTTCTYLFQPPAPSYSSAEPKPFSYLLGSPSSTALGEGGRPDLGTRSASFSTGCAGAAG